VMLEPAVSEVSGPEDNVELANDNIDKRSNNQMSDKIGNSVLNLEFCFI